MNKALGIGALIVALLLMLPKRGIGRLGDVNGDGRIDAADLSLLRTFFGQRVNPADARMLRADINGDGWIDIMDYSALVAMLE